MLTKAVAKTTVYAPVHAMRPKHSQAAVVHTGIGNKTNERINMKLLKILAVYLGLLAVLFSAQADDLKSSVTHWYQVTISQQGYNYQMTCTSTLAEADFIATLSKGDGFIVLDNLLYRDNTGKYKSWSEWDPTMQPRIYVRASAIVTLQPLVGDPRKSSDSGNK